MIVAEVSGWCGAELAAGEDLRYPGIYVLVDVDSGKGYVGETRHLSERRKQHFGAIARGRHHSKQVQALLDENPRRPFRFLVLALCFGAFRGYDELRAIRQAGDLAISRPFTGWGAGGWV